MAGTYFDGDSGVGYAWAGSANQSQSYYSSTATTVTQATLGDLTAGNWSIEESATPLDILDTSGSVGGVSATFKRNPQSIANGPTATPNASSSYLQGQPCNFAHPLGTVNGYITSVSPTGSSVSIEQSTPLSILNVNMTMPPYVEGSLFYSFALKDSSGNPLYYSDMAVMPDGNLIMTGAKTGTDATAVYDRFGNYMWGITHSAFGYGVDLDSAGNIYVKHIDWVEKFNPDGTGAATFVASAGYNISRMAIDTATGNVWLATMDTTTGKAIKVYNSSGSLILQTGNFSFSSTYVNNTTYYTYTGMAFDYINGNAYVGNVAFDGNGALQYYYNIITTAGVSTGPFFIGTPHTETARNGVGIDFSKTSTTGPKPIFLSGSGLYDVRGSFLNTSVKSKPFPGTAYPDTSPALAIDKFGGMFALTQGTVYRMASGYMSVNQAIECYLGAAGYRGSVTYGAHLAYHQNVTLYNIPLPYAVNFPGWTGNAWSKIKELCARGKRQITTDGSGIKILRTDNRLDAVKLDISNHKDAPAITEGQPGAQVIKVTSQNVTVPNGNWGLLYTSKQSDSELTVDLGGFSTSTLSLGVHAAGIDQPVGINPYIVPPTTVTDGPPSYNVINYSAYAIVDSSTPPLQVDMPTWTKNGGSLRYAINTDSPGSIDVYLSGPNALAGYTGPFSVAYLLGGQKIPYFTISGYGLRVNPTDFDVYTGAPLPVAAEVNSQQMDSVFIDTIAAGYDMARQSSIALGHGELSLSVTIPVSSLTVGLGSIGGSYFYWSRNYWRVVSAKISGGWVDITAVRDTRMFDVQDGNITHAGIDNTWAGYRYLDNYLSPGILGE